MFYYAVRKGLVNVIHVGLIPSVLHARLHPHVAFTRRTNERILGTFKPESSKALDANKHSVLRGLTSLVIWHIRPDESESVKRNIVCGLSIEESVSW